MGIPERDLVHSRLTGGTTKGVRGNFVDTRRAENLHSCYYKHYRWLCSLGSGQRMQPRHTRRFAKKENLP